MRKIMRITLAALALPLVAASAQEVKQSGGEVATDSTAASLFSMLPPITMQNYRPADMRGINMFEAPKEAGIPFTGFRMSWGAAFRQTYQGLEHYNTAVPVMSGTTNANQLMTIGHGFNLADANLSLNMQIADGIRVHLSTYASSKHHQETWVKDGYFMMDKSPINHPLLNKIMEYTSLKIGHFETNFGDAHFRRSDNGNAMHNPFVGNLLIDAFTTEVGGEAYFRTGPFLAMVGVNSGTINGGITTPEKRTNAYLGKLGFDRKLNEDLRVRLTGSYYKNDKSPSNTLLTGDRAGNTYDLVMENTAASLTSNAWSGQMRQMGFSNSLRAYTINPFIRWNGVEFFGSMDNFKGKSLTEPSWRTWTQNSAELLYRFWDDKLYAGGRVNTAEGSLLSTPTVTYTGDVGLQRKAFAAGWYVTPVLLLKGELMRQDFYRFPARDIRNGGKIQGFTVEGVVSF